MSQFSTAQKMMFSIKDFFSKCWSHLVKKSLMENFIFSAGFGIIKIQARNQVFFRAGEFS